MGGAPGGRRRGPYGRRRRLQRGDDLAALRLKYLGAFADTFGIRPWEWDAMNAQEALLLIRYIDEANERNKGAEGGDL